MATGAALLRLEPDMTLDRITSDELSFGEVDPWLNRAIDIAQASEAKLYLAVETFVITTSTARNTQAPWSLEVIGVVRNIAFQRGLPSISMQSPGSVKSLVTNDMLRALGVYHVGGAGHANDALRHAVYQLVRQGARDLLRVSGG